MGTAGPGAALTVPAMPTPLRTLHHRQATAPRRTSSALALVSGMRATTPDGPAAPVAVAATQLNEPMPRLPAAAVTRSVDPSGRVKFAGTWSLCELLGFEPGTLRVTTHQHWLVLTQPDHLRGDARARFDDLARFTVGKSGERLGLSDAHLRRCQLGPDRHLLLTPLPAQRALVVVNPAVAFLAAPAAVNDALRAADRSVGA